MAKKNIIRVGGACTAACVRIERGACTAEGVSAAVESLEQRRGRTECGVVRKNEAVCLWHSDVDNRGSDRCTSYTDRKSTMLYSRRKCCKQ